jgi:hypothetical protein
LGRRCFISRGRSTSRSRPRRPSRSASGCSDRPG